MVAAVGGAHSATTGSARPIAIATTTTTTTTTESSLSVATILMELTMTVAVAALPTTSSSSVSSLLDLIHHITKYSAEASVETVRMVATSALGLLSRRLSDYHHSLSTTMTTSASNLNHYTTGSDDPTTATDIVVSSSITDMTPLWDALQQAILSRLTDTAVAVRGAAVGCVFDSRRNDCTTLTGTNVLSADPDCHQAVVWMLQHDSSPTNRARAASRLPVTWQSMDYLVYRLRDTKAVVRVAAIGALHQATIGSSGSSSGRTSGVGSDGTSGVGGGGTTGQQQQPRLQPHHMAELITAGCTDRCLATKQAIRRLICTVWMKHVQYNPITLLEWLDVVPHTFAATTLIRLLLETAADPTLLLTLDNLNNGDTSNDNHGTTTTVQQHVAALQLGLSRASFFSMEPWTRQIPPTPTASRGTDSVDTGEDDHYPNHTSDVTSTLPVERLFYVRIVIEHTTSSSEKEALLSHLVPDIIVLCQVLEHFTSQLIRILAADDDGAVDEEDKLIFICSELLRVATMNATAGSTMMEEGSRRVFTSAMKRMLINLVTPDDLVEGCCKALWQSEGASHIETHVLWIVNELQRDTCDSLRDNATLRILAILTTLLAATGSGGVDSCVSAATGTTGTTAMAPSTMALDAYSAFIIPFVTDATSGQSHSEPQLALVREAAVTCLGHLGFVSDVVTVRDTYQPMVVAIATNESERTELRMQAVLAWMDWSVLFRCRMSSPDAIESMRGLVGAWMEPHPHHSMATVCIAAEMATKLLLLHTPQREGPETATSLPNGPVWLARLVWLFFETADRGGCTDDDDDAELVDDETRLGSPVRLQQILSLFFPVFASGTGDWPRNTLIESIAPLLAMSTATKNAKTKGRRKSSPIAKMLDYIVSTVHQGHAQRREMMDSSGEKTPKSSSPSLLAAIQVATFVSEKGSDLTTTVRRMLCKMIGGTVVADINNELREHLSLLKELIEELTGNVLDDDPQCLRALQTISERLVDVEVEDDVTSDDEIDEDEASSTDAGIPEVERMAVSNENTPDDSQKNRTSRRQHRSNILLSSN